MRTICFVDSERYFAYCTWYGRGTNHASVQFLLLISCCLAYVRTIRARVSSFRAIFYIISTLIRNYPSTFFQNTYTILVRKFLFIFSVISVKFIANLICSYRVSCACEPFDLSIPNGISCTVRDTPVVRITRPSSFSFWFGVASRTCERSARALVVFVLYSELFWHRFVIIRLLSFKIHIRYSYEFFIHFFQSFQSN